MFGDEQTHIDKSRVNGIFAAVVSFMVLILDGNSEHVPHAWRKIGLFGE